MSTANPTQAINGPVLLFRRRPRRQREQAAKLPPLVQHAIAKLQVLHECNSSVARIVDELLDDLIADQREFGTLP